MRIEHRSASRHITDEQSDLATEEKERRPNFARSEIKVRLSKINSDAGREQAPPARMLISESSEANWEHVNQGANSCRWDWSRTARPTMSRCKQ